MCLNDFVCPDLAGRIDHLCWVHVSKKTGNFRPSDLSLGTFHPGSSLHVFAEEKAKFFMNCVPTKHWGERQVDPRGTPTKLWQISKSRKSSYSKGGSSPLSSCKAHGEESGANPSVLPSPESVPPAEMKCEPGWPRTPKRLPGPPPKCLGERQRDLAPSAARRRPAPRSPARLPQAMGSSQFSSPLGNAVLDL